MQTGLDKLRASVRKSEQRAKVTSRRLKEKMEDLEHWEESAVAGLLAILAVIMTVVMFGIVFFRACMDVLQRIRGWFSFSKAR